MYCPALGTRRMWSPQTTALHLLEIVYRLDQLKFVTLTFTIPNILTGFIQKQNENLRYSKHEYHVLTLGENLCDIFCMNPHIYTRKNTIPIQNMPQFYAISPLTFDRREHDYFHTSTKLPFHTYNLPAATCTTVYA